MIISMPSWDREEKHLEPLQVYSNSAMDGFQEVDEEYEER